MLYNARMETMECGGTTGITSTTAAGRANRSDNCSSSGSACGGGGGGGGRRRNGESLIYAPTAVCVLIRLLGMNDAEFAEFGGVSVSAVRQYRYGQKEPDVDRLYDWVQKSSSMGIETTVDALIEEARRQRQQQQCSSDSSSKDAQTCSAPAT